MKVFPTFGSIERFHLCEGNYFESSRTWLYLQIVIFINILVMLIAMRYFQCKYEQKCININAVSAQLANGNDFIAF